MANKTNLNADTSPQVVYTFNGAGVGDVLPSYGGLAGLSGVLAEFEAQRAEGANARLIAGPVARGSNEREFRHAA